MADDALLTYLFIGDSVTDCGRLESDDGLGDGYVRLVGDGLASEGMAVNVINRGISGNRVSDLRARWQEDCLDLKPDLVSILIGINDTWRRFDGDDPVSSAKFEADYRALLKPLAGVDLVLVEPFLLPASDEQQLWRDDLDPKIEAVRRLAVEFGATLVPADKKFNAYAKTLGVDALAPDGVHPSPEGHEFLARVWQNVVLNQPHRSPPCPEDTASRITGPHR